MKQFLGWGFRNGSTNYFFCRDHLRSVRTVTDNTGAIQASYAFDPWGRSTKLEGALDADWTFAGMYAHSRSGLNLTLFRAYSPSTGTWLSRDPLEEFDGPNMYSYAGLNPVSLIDPVGLFHFDPAACCRIAKQFAAYAKKSRAINKEVGAEFNFNRKGQPVFGPTKIGSSDGQIGLSPYAPDVAMTHVLGGLLAPQGDASGFNPDDLNRSITSEQTLWTVNASGNIFILEKGHMYEITAGCKDCWDRGMGRFGTLPAGQQRCP